MIAGYLLIGIVTGLVAFVAALFLGTSFLFAFGLYTLVGSLTMILVSIMGLLLGRFGDQSLQPVATDRLALQRDRALRPATSGPDAA